MNETAPSFLAPTSWSIADVIVLGILLISTLIGGIRGFSREILGLTAWVAAFFIASWGFRLVLPLVHALVSNHLIADVIAFILLFLLALALCTLVARRISDLVLNSPLGGLDRLLGLGFGLLRGCIVAGLLYLAGARFAPAPDWAETLRGSVLQPSIAFVASKIDPLIPKFMLPGLAPDGMARHDHAEYDPESGIRSVINDVTRALPREFAGFAGRQGTFNPLTCRAHSCCGLPEEA